MFSSEATIVRLGTMPRCRLRVAQTALLACEGVVAATLLTLFGFAYPNRFRTRLWEEGGAHKWNSDPRLRIYFYANHREPPEVPLIWSQRYAWRSSSKQLGRKRETDLVPRSLTASNLSIAVLTTFVFITRMAVSRCSFLPEYTNVFYDLLLLTLWSVSVAGQLSGDRSDSKHACSHPWYLVRGCAETSGQNQGYCRIAQASFVFSLLALVVYGARLLLCSYVALFEKDRECHGDLKCGPDHEEKSSFSDLEWAPEREVKRHGWLDQPLSPVLAFFPETPR
ncbi:hypothetical protein PCL_03998 [Purpureocillium lilacinum]|uniref:Uncharacterized protein n=1 Tax=Purpureocillium lilacinum TaxID=33203 RepID=A0A2U3EQM4_PURLI|nr:hypothetical protein PCL_03998 [Purpureocillium lilacinum]